MRVVARNEVSTLLDVSLSNLYPALNELASEGLVTYRKVEQDNRPNKKIYEVTQAGKEKFLDVACNSVELRDSFQSEVFFILTVARLMPPERVDQILDQWIKFSVDRLDTVESMIEEYEQAATQLTLKIHTYFMLAVDGI